jgi:hypothetical protein
MENQVLEIFFSFLVGNYPGKDNFTVIQRIMKKFKIFSFYTFKVKLPATVSLKYSIKEQVKSDNDQILKDLGVGDLVLGFGI